MLDTATRTWLHDTNDYMLKLHSLVEYDGFVNKSLDIFGTCDASSITITTYVPHTSMVMKRIV